MDLNETAVFVKVAQLGSFTKAARALGMPASTVSAKVAALETRLGHTLIRRTTRRLHITETGHTYFLQAAAGLDAIVAAEAQLAASHDEPRGLLKVTAPLDIGNTLMPDVLIRYTTTYPKVRLELITDDRKVDLLSEGFDLAIRAGVLQDSTLIARRIGRAHAQPYASPTYLAQHGTPKHPKELAHHMCVQFLPMGRESWRLCNGKQTLDIPMTQHCLMSDRGLTRQLALAHRGVALMPPFMCRAEVEAGQLVEVLPGWHTPFAPVHFVYPPQKFVPPQLTAFMGMAMPAIRDVLATDGEGVA